MAGKISVIAVPSKLERVGEGGRAAGGGGYDRPAHGVGARSVQLFDPVDFALDVSIHRHVERTARLDGGEAGDDQSVERLADHQLACAQPFDELRIGPDAALTLKRQQDFQGPY